MSGYAPPPPTVFTGALGPASLSDSNAVAPAAHPRGYFPYTLPTGEVVYVPGYARGVGSRSFQTLEFTYDATATDPTVNLATPAQAGDTIIVATYTGQTVTGVTANANCAFARAAAEYVDARWEVWDGVATGAVASVTVANQNKNTGVAVTILILVLPATAVGARLSTRTAANPQGQLTTAPDSGALVGTKANQVVVGFLAVRQDLPNSNVTATNQTPFPWQVVGSDLKANVVNCFCNAVVLSAAGQSADWAVTLSAAQFWGFVLLLYDAPA